MHFCILAVVLFGQLKLWSRKSKIQIAQIVSLTSKVWLFVSAFDKNGNLIISNGVMKTDRSIEQLIESFYQGILKKKESEIKVWFWYCWSTSIANDPNILVKLSMKERGIFLVESEWQNSGVLLPNTKGVDTIQQWLSMIKQKYNLKISGFSLYFLRLKE